MWSICLLFPSSTFIDLSIALLSTSLALENQRCHGWSTSSNWHKPFPCRHSVLNLFQDDLGDDEITPDDPLPSPENSGRDSDERRYPNDNSQWAGKRSKYSPNLASTIVGGRNVCYDNRFCLTQRSPKVYLDETCKVIVGGDVTVVTILNDDYLDLDKSENSGVSKKDTVGRQLLVIAVPYKAGSHIVNKLTDFIQIIQQLQDLHAKGYVHGDIRGFNVLFSENGGGGLIDFDFSGTPEKDSYPPGYRQALNDGLRKGDGKPESEDKKLAFWHDWYALGKLIFTYHDIEVPSKALVVDRLTRQEVEDYWKKISEPPSQEMIIGLINTLKRLEQAGFTVEPNSNFQKEANSTRALNVTKQGATGSPLQV